MPANSTSNTTSSAWFALSDLIRAGVLVNYHVRQQFPAIDISLPMNERRTDTFADFQAILCDMDGVITKTAVLHAAAWKRLFDEYLTKLAARMRSHYSPFKIEEDYRL